MNLRSLSIAFLVGILFAAGLILSGMIYPKNVQDFLDIFGQWNPALLWVLGASVGVTFLTFPLILSRKEPVWFHRFVLPTKKELDGKLVVGSILFGMGWAISGMCPGPAFVNVLSLSPKVLVFVLLMLIVYALYEITLKNK